MFSLLLFLHTVSSICVESNLCPSNGNGVYVDETIYETELKIVERLAQPSACWKELTKFYCGLYMPLCDLNQKAVKLSEDVCVETFTCLNAESYDIRRNSFVSMFSQKYTGNICKSIVFKPFIEESKKINIKSPSRVNFFESLVYILLFFSIYFSYIFLNWN